MLCYSLIPSCISFPSIISLLFLILLSAFCFLFLLFFSYSNSLTPLPTPFLFLLYLSFIHPILFTHLLLSSSSFVVLFIHFFLIFFLPIYPTTASVLSTAFLWSLPAFASSVILLLPILSSPLSHSVPPTPPFPLPVSCFSCVCNSL